MNSNNKVWWAEPMMWLVLGLPTVVVVAGLMTFWLAASQPQTMANEPHRKVGLTVERVTPAAPAQQQ